MQENRNENRLGMRRILAVILIVGAVLFAVYWNIRLSAEESPSVVRVKEYLEKDAPFYVQAEGFAERNAIQRIIKQHNKDQGYSADEMYRTYKFTDNEYWVTGEKRAYYEFYSEAGDYYMCLGDMASEVRYGKEIFYFVCIDEKLQQEFDMMLEVSVLATEKLDIYIEKKEGKEVTAYCITVEPKTQVGKGVI